MAAPAPNGDTGGSLPRILAISSGGTALASIACFTLGFNLSRRYAQGGYTSDEYGDMLATNHALLISSGVLVGLAAGAGAGAVITGRF